MWSAFVVMGLLQAGPPAQAIETKSRIVAASVFKPGVALIVREAKIPAGKGRYKLDVLPEILEGSFWYGSPEGAEIEEVKTTLKFGETTVKNEAKTVADYLMASEGKPVRLTVTGAKGEPEPLAGTIASVLPGNNPPAITLKLANGNLRVVYTSQVIELDPAGLNTTLERKVPTVVQQIEFTADAKRASTVRFLTLENGAAWSGSYLVLLDDPAKAEMTAKAQLVVGSLTFENTEVQVLAGMPALPAAPKFDLAAGFGSMIAWIRGSQEQYRAYRQGPKDPYTQIATILQEAQARLRVVHSDPTSSFFSGVVGMGQGAAFGAYGGGYGGTPDIDANYGGRPSGGPAEGAAETTGRIEDLFSYPLGKLSLMPGDRLTRLLLKEAPGFERLYRWEITFKTIQYQAPQERSRVLKLLRLSNRGKAPWTGGLALVMKDGNPLAQTEMPFTAVGQEADLELGEVQDIPVTREARELKREPAQLFNRTYTAITVETKLMIENSRSEPIVIEVRHDLSGDVLEAPGAEVTTLGTALNAANKNSRVLWTVRLAPGEKKELSYTVKTLV